MPEDFAAQSKWLIEQMPPESREYVRDYLVKQLVDPFTFMEGGRFDKAGYIAVIDEWEARARDATTSADAQEVAGGKE